MSEFAFEPQYRSQCPVLNQVAEFVCPVLLLERSIMKNLSVALLLFAFMFVCAPPGAAQKKREANPKPPASQPVITAAAPSQPAPPATNAQAGVLQGKVVDLGWGDAITVLDAQGKQRRVRLLGIDAPEKEQAFGPAARQKLSVLVFGKTVAVKYQKTDRSGRPLGKVMSGTMDVNLEMLKAGLAWYYPNDTDLPESDRPLYAGAEREAKAARRGLWQDESPQSPWEFRLARRQQKSVPPGTPSTTEPETTASVTNAEGESDAAAEKANVAVTDPGAAASGEGEASASFPKAPRITVMGDNSTHIYYKTGCPEGEKIAPQNRIKFASIEDAEGAGFKRTPNCP